MKIVAIEGIDGSGKTLQLSLLEQRLQMAGKNYKTLSFPQYDRFFGKEIGAMLSGHGPVRADEADAKSMALWYAMDRWEAFKQLDTTGVDVLLLNRYTLSNAVYQSLRAAEGDIEKQAAFAQWVLELEHEVLGLPKPQQYILLDVSHTLSKQNVAKKGYREYTGDDAPDVYEQKQDFLAQVRQVYLHLAETLGNIHTIACTKNNAMKPPEDIAESIWKVI